MNGGKESRTWRTKLGTLPLLVPNHENPTELSATEWLDVFVDQQGQIRRGVLKNGYWLIDVARAGEYEIELRRWPKERMVRSADSCPMAVALLCLLLRRCCL